MFGSANTRVAALLDDFSSSIDPSAVILKDQKNNAKSQNPFLNKITIVVLGLILISSIAFNFFLFAAPLCLAVVLFVYARRRLAYLKEFNDFDRDFPVFLSAVASAVRAGDDPWRAFVESGKLFPKTSPLYKEVEIIRERVDAGAREHEALLLFGAKTKHPDLKLLRGAFELALKNGSSLAECLVRLARVSRQRQSFKRKVRAALAMQRLSSIGIGLSALAICVFQTITNKASVIAAWSSPTGGPLLKVGLGLLLLGLIWMSRVGREAVE